MPENETETDEDGGVQAMQPVDIIRIPNLEHRFSRESPLSVGLATPVNVGFTESPVRVGFGEAPANVNMNIITPKGVGVSLLGSSAPIALRLVIPEEEQLIARSAYTISMKVGANEICSVNVGGTTTLHTKTPEK